MSTRVTQSAIQNSVDMADITNEYGVISEAAKILRRHIMLMSQWKFQGKFDDFEIPLVILTFCNAVIKGKRKIQTNERESDLYQSSSLLVQLIIQLSKTDRQTSYTPMKRASQFNTRRVARVWHP